MTYIFHLSPGSNHDYWLVLYDASTCQPSLWSIELKVAMQWVENCGIPTCETSFEAGHDKRSQVEAADVDMPPHLVCFMKFALD